jgi:predicted HicB family RNase H-like nuclease
MADRSQSKDDFLGLYIRSEMKERARRRAEKQGISLSEFVRRQLDHLDDAAEQQAVTA